MRELLVYQAIWGLEGLDGFDLSGDMEGVLDKVLGAGFDGVGIGLGRAGQCEAVARGLRERGKTWEATAFIRTADDLARAIERAQALGAHHLNVQILERRDRVSEAVALLQQLEAVAVTADIPVHYETHRGRLTNDLLFTVRILDAMPQLKLTGDLSHYAVVHEMPLPVPESDAARMSRVIAHCCGFHGRVAGSHQVQVSICAPQHREWVEQFRAWWREGFAAWLARSGPDATLSFMPELGPPNYAIVGPDGRELADRWREALLLKDMAREIWAELTQPAPVA
ncbi:MAG TPA: hypothetical protein VHZ26_11130 [Caulobacteraceae bacterium]|jgi:sugar phosphate isomerase/epimerase|nr:hypothetical protein [Caulobacteraceae bacterium]